MCKAFRQVLLDSEGPGFTCKGPGKSLENP